MTAPHPGLDSTVSPLIKPFLNMVASTLSSTLMLPAVLERLPQPSLALCTWDIIQVVHILRMASNMGGAAYGLECRYSGYCAWRGVMKESENPEVAAEVRREYKDMGRALYFDVIKGSHAVVYELPDKRLNWLW